MRNLTRILSSTAVLAIMVGSNAFADQVILDDLIVDGSICVGLDCVNGESFGFDTLRLKENNLRIKAQDTSSTASFPTTDWQITFNDSSNGGANKFSIDEIDGGKTPFTIRAGARTNALFINSSGRVGFGTNAPVVDLHVRNGNTPTLRLEQDGSSGFTPQTWDVAGNEANFFIRDATNGSTLPFRIQPGAPSNAIYVKATTGDVGIGYTAPTAPLHVRRSNGTAKVFVEETTGTVAARELAKFKNAGDLTVALENTSGNSWSFANLGGDARIISPDGPGIEFKLTTDGDLTITGELTTTGGTCGSGCDLVFDESYKLESIEEHAKLMWEKKHLPNVGPTIENAPINVSDKVGRILNELEKAHIYIEQLHKQYTGAKDDISRLEARLEKIAGQSGSTSQ